MNRNIANYILSLLVVSLAFLASSCDTFDAEAEVPAYVKIDSILVVTQSIEGTNKQQFSDVWFNLDGSQVGTFEIPTQFPVIAKGRHPISIWAGVKKSGISDFRVIHPFFEPVRDTLDFVGTEIISYTPTFRYIPETKFWIEDFEDPGIDLHTNDSTNYLTQITDPDNADNKVGYIFLPDSVDAFHTYTIEEFQSTNTPVFMEIDYKGDQTFGVGIIMNHPGGSKESIRPFTLIKPKEDWNKLYLNLGEQFYINPGADSYDVYFFFTSVDNGTAKVYLDNIKILTF